MLDYSVVAFALRLLLRVVTASLHLLIATHCYSDKDNETTQTMEVFRELGIIDPSPVDLVTVRYVCALVSNRGAKIVSSGK